MAGTTATGAGQQGDTGSASKEGPGEKPAGLISITVITVFSVALTLLLFYLLLAFWPYPTPAMTYDVEPVAADTGGQVVDTSAAQADTPAAGTQGAPNAGAGAAPVAPLHYTWALRCDPTALRAWMRANAGKQPHEVRVDPKCVSVFRRQYLLTDEKRLVLLVILAGALGGMLHVLRSLGWYVGNRKLVRSWLLYYWTLPFVGAILGLIFYLVIRGGFFNSTSRVDETNPFAFVAVAALMGMFSQQAVLKLKEVTETLFTEPQGGKDSATQETGTEKPAQGETNPQTGGDGAGGGAGSVTPAAGAPTIAGARRITGPDGEPLVEVTGTGFGTGTTVQVNGEARAAAVESDTRLTAPLVGDEALAGETISVRVENPGGGSAEIQAA
ncbi:MAG TPA: hypothetical protein VFX98_06045 [Longimicrobiaceae bacterium]|nr:hypothetical protein [Longimicrobiaceae bacterium]